MEIGFVLGNYLAHDIVDGRNFGPPDMYETLQINGIFTISTGAGFLPSPVAHRLRHTLLVVSGFLFLWSDGS